MAVEMSEHGTRRSRGAARPVRTRAVRVCEIRRPVRPRSGEDVVSIRTSGNLGSLFRESVGL